MSTMTLGTTPGDELGNYAVQLGEIADAIERLEPNLPAYMRGPLVFLRNDVREARRKLGNAAKLLGARVR